MNISIVYKRMCKITDRAQLMCNLITRQQNLYIKRHHHLPTIDEDLKMRVGAYYEVLNHIRRLKDQEAFIANREVKIYLRGALD